MRFSVEGASFNKKKEQIQVLTKLLFNMEDVSEMHGSSVKRSVGASPKRNSHPGHENQMASHSSVFCVDVSKRFYYP